MIEKVQIYSRDKKIFIYYTEINKSFNKKDALEIINQLDKQYNTDWIKMPLVVINRKKYEYKYR